MDSESAQPIFAGEFRHAMDAKNRVTVPSRWRRGEIDEFFAIPNPDTGILMVMPLSEFKRQVEKVEQDASIPAVDRRKFIRLFSARAQQVSSDKQGRMVLPDDQCKLLGLQGEVVLVGNFTRFDIWPPAKWQKTATEDESTYTYILERAGI
jgi:MraZ protein